MREQQPWSELESPSRGAHLDNRSWAAQAFARSIRAEHFPSEFCGQNQVAPTAGHLEHRHDLARLEAGQAITYRPDRNIKSGLAVPKRTNLSIEVRMRAIHGAECADSCRYAGGVPGRTHFPALPAIQCEPCRAGHALHEDSNEKRGEPRLATRGCA